MRNHFKATPLLVLGLTWVTCVAGCANRSLSPAYCQGGVDRKGESMGGECLFTAPDARADDPNIVATAHWQSDSVPNRYGVRRTTKNKYDLLLNGTLAGTIEQDDNWIKVKFNGDPRGTYSLRNDPPGFLN